MWICILAVGDLGLFAEFVFLGRGVYLLGAWIYVSVWELWGLRGFVFLAGRGGLDFVFVLLGSGMCIFCWQRDLGFSVGICECFMFVFWENGFVCILNCLLLQVEFNFASSFCGSGGVFGGI